MAAIDTSVCQQAAKGDAKLFNFLINYSALWRCFNDKLHKVITIL